MAGLSSDIARLDARFALKSTDISNIQSSSEQRSFADGYSSTNGSGFDLNHTSSAYDVIIEEIPFNDWSFITVFLTLNPIKLTRRTGQLLWITQYTCIGKRRQKNLDKIETRHLQDCYG